MKCSNLHLAALLLSLVCLSSVTGQKFELIGSNGATAHAEITGNSLVTTIGNVRTRYSRSPNYDQFVGFRAYASAAIQQVIQWPDSGRGHMKTGESTAAGIGWTRSDMQVHRVQAKAAGQFEKYKLVLPEGRLLGTAAQSTQQLRLSINGVLEVYQRNKTYDSFDQMGYFSVETQRFVLWPSTGVGSVRIGESRNGAVNWRTGNFTVQPDRNANIPVIPVPRVPLNRWPIEKSLGREVVANPPMEPVDVTMKNGSPNAILVLVTDHRRNGAGAQHRIEPNGSHTIQIDRDPGGAIVEKVEVRWPDRTDIQERVKKIPPKPFYSLSVYELIAQSKYYGKGGKLEDVRYGAKSVGMILVPAGSRFGGGSTDIFKEAVNKRNPGAVVRLDDPTNLETTGAGLFQ